MAIFAYKAVNSRGETLEGRMEAASSEDVIRRLQEAGNIPIKAEPLGEGGAVSLARLFKPSSGVSQADIGIFTRQLATLLEAGLPLERSLQILEELSDKLPMRKLIGRVREDVREGATMSDALEQQHGVFTKLYINMVRAGELGGSLEQSLLRLADYMERAKALKDSVVSALIYPMILLGLSGVSLAVLLLVVVPQFKPMFDQLGGDMPLLTQLVLGFAEGVKAYWWIVLLLGLALILWARRQLRDADKRYWFDEKKMRLPLVGELLSKLEMARLSRTLGTLLVNGVPMIAALSISRKVIANAVLVEAVENASKAVKTGGSLSRELAADGHLPKMAIQMISVGEETGRMDAMLMKVADTYDEETRITIERLLALMVPVTTVLLAVFIGAIVMSVFLAILSVNDLAV